MVIYQKQFLTTIPINQLDVLSVIFQPQLTPTTPPPPTKIPKAGNHDHVKHMNSTKIVDVLMQIGK